MREKPDPRFIVLIPAFNEASRIGPLVDEAARQVRIVVVVDDGSRDDTSSRAEAAGAVVLRAEGNAGKGAALRRGIDYILSKFEFEAAIFMDADGQHLPADLRRFTEVWNERRPDVVLGARSFGRPQAPIGRALWNRAISCVVSVAAGKWLPDTQCGFRLFSRAALERLRTDRPGYEIETEMLLAAVRQGLDIVEVPVQSRYGVRDSRLGEDIGRALTVGLYAAAHALRACARRRLAGPDPGLGGPGQAWRWAGAILFTALLLVGLRQGHRSLRQAPSREQGSFAQEFRAALRWLGAHAEPDAVVMAHWFRGHQIIAHANRRVVATTKVYPSEATETASRYRDIAGFFLSEDENAAKAIAARYGASYVFADKAFQAWLCKAIDRCDYAASNPWALNAVGYSRTVAGRMALRGAFRGFKLVWDSPRFVIYRITDRDPGLSQDERKLALRIARRTITALVQDGRRSKASQFRPWLREESAVEAFARRRDVGVAVWNGGVLRASRLASGATLLENVVEAACRATRDDRFPLLAAGELKTMRIEVTVFEDDYAPLTRDRLAANVIDPLQGYRIVGDGAAATFLPEVFLVGKRKELSELLSDLCAKGGWRRDCYRRWTPETFRVDDFIEGPSGGVLRLSGTVAAPPDAPLRDLLGERVRLAADWLLRVQKPDGRFVFKLDPLSGVESQSLDPSRNALAGQSLAEAYLATGNERYLAAARRNAAYLKRDLSELQRRDAAFIPSAPRLKFASLENLSLFEATRDPAYLAEASRLAELMFRRQAGARALRGRDLADYQTLYMMLRLAGPRRDDALLKELSELAQAYLRRFRSERILMETQQSLAVQAWLANAFSELYRLTQDRSHADFAFEVASWLADHQHVPGETARDGAFFNRPGDRFIYTRGTGKATEAVVDAYLLASSLGAGHLAERYHASLSRSFRWLAAMQLTPDNAYFIDDRNKGASIGGLRHDLLNHDLWNDSAAHFLLAASNYLRHAPRAKK